MPERIRCRAHELAKATPNAKRVGGLAALRDVVVMGAMRGKINAVAEWEKKQ